MTDRNNMILTVNKEGQFVGRRTHEWQCGRTGYIPYRYKVSISGRAHKLSVPERFIINNAYIDQYFEKRYVDEAEECPSCEVMACEAIEYFRSLCEAEGPCDGVDLTRIEINIWGSPVSNITGIWEKIV